jgi:hypothetical protein
MKHFSKLMVLAAMQCALAQGAAAETRAYSGTVATGDFFRFIEEHSGDAVRVAAEGALPAEQMEKTDDGVFFWQTNVQVGIEPGAYQDDKIAINGCYRVRLADMRQGVTAYFLDPSDDCEQ